jgi:hypothetical protein
MATDPNAPRRDDQHQEVRLYLLLLALAVILLAVAGLCYVTYQHPALAGPLGVGAAAPVSSPRRSPSSCASSRCDCTG